MKLPTLTWKDSGLTKQTLHRYEQRLASEVRQMPRSGYDDVRASINLSLDKNSIRMSNALARKYKNVHLMIVVGIGGSNLGTMAVQEAVLGKMHNLHGKPLVLYADTVDSQSVTTMNALLKRTLQARKQAVVNVISKSGGTTETIANAEVFVSTLQRYRKDYHKYVVVTSGEGSKLWQLAERNGFATLPIPENVGGRYSVFSPVGLFPLAVAGIKIEKLLKGAADMRQRCLSLRNNPAVIRAGMLAHARQRGKNIADNFYFKTDLESIGKWYRQLMGESIGKEWNKQHSKRLWMGITPTVSIGTTDLHSMAQLYFGGPKDKIHTIVSVKKWNNEVKLPTLKAYDAVVPNIQGKKLSTIMDAVVQGVTAVLKKQKRPLCRIELADSNEYSIGALLQLHMMEMIYLGALLNVNPFDQPNVEVYKIETKRVLAK